MENINVLTRSILFLFTYRVRTRVCARSWVNQSTVKSEVGAPCREIVAEAQSNANRQASNPPLMAGPSETAATLPSLDSDATLRPVPFATS
jgi:hypothetical protein